MEKSRRNVMFWVLLVIVSLIIYSVALLKFYECRSYLIRNTDWLTRNRTLQQFHEQEPKEELGGERQIKIAIGMAITSQKLKINFTDASEEDVSSMPFFSDFLPSFCKTISSGYYYSLYIAFDRDDPFFQLEQNRVAFTATFDSYVSNNCPAASLDSIEVSMVRCNYSGMPPWAQNDAMMQAYYGNNTYLYRINDDTVLTTRGWTETFIRTLSGHDPSNIGIVGPTHSFGNKRILTYEFVHRMHIDIFGFYYPRYCIKIFGFYYPRTYKGWYAYGWMTRLYLPDRVTQLDSVHVEHVESLGRRYDKHAMNWTARMVDVESGKIVLERYIEQARK